MDNDIVKLMLFPFSLRDRAKTWFSSLPKNCIDSWNKCKVLRLELALVFPEEEGMMQQSSVSISLSF